MWYAAGLSTRSPTADSKAEGERPPVGNPCSSGRTRHFRGHPFHYPATKLRAGCDGRALIGRRGRGSSGGVSGASGICGSLRHRLSGRRDLSGGCPLPNTLAGFNVNVECSTTAHSEAAATITAYQLTSTATQGTVATPSYVARKMTVTIAP
jgi:hypothetical protein